MGGKVKQRTKGNTKPSSSGRAAELLSRDGSTGFVGFGDVGSTSDGGSLQFVPASGDPEGSVHADFQIVMKKLTKRDAVTKLKAVQEFGELCKTCAMEAVLGALPYWPRLYNKLALDVDYRVREATQHAMSQVALRVGRNFAPHLKSVMGVWMCSQCDPYLPVATAAQKAFSVAFSESKQLEVLGFCKKEVLEYLRDNLMNQSPDTLCDPTMYDEKDRLTKFIRVIASSLQALAKFIKVVSEEINVQMDQYYRDLTAEKKFWKLGKHKSPQIRAAFFVFVTVFCQKLLDAVQASATSVCPIVLGSIDEADATVSGHLWEAVLGVVSTIQDCWKHVNIAKAVLPKFWNFLSNAAYGNANVVFPSLLPFLAKLPDEVIFRSSGSDFPEKLFSNLIEGLKLSKVQQSPSECKAVVSGFMDCAQYVGSERFEEKMNEDEFQRLKIYVVEQLVTVVDLSLQPKLQISCTSIYDRLGKFLRDCADDFDIENYFWNVFDELVHKKVLDGDKGNETTFQSILKCLCSLKSPGVSSQRLKAGAKVRFQEENADKSEDTKAVKHKHKVGWQKKNSDIDVNLLFGGKLLHTVSKTLRSCLEAVLKEESKSHLELLTELLNEFYSPFLLNDVLETLSVLGVQDYSECGDVLEKDEGSRLRRKCINMLVLPLFKTSVEHGTACKEKWLQSLVKLLFVFMNQGEGDDQETVLESVFQVNSSSKILYLIVKEIMDAEHFLHLSRIEGLKIGRKVVKLMRESLNVSSLESSGENGQVYIWKILDLCFGHSDLLDYFFNEDSMIEMLEMFHKTLADGDVALAKLISVVEIVENFVQNTKTLSSKSGPKFELMNGVVVDLLQLRLHGYHEQSHFTQCWNSITSVALSDEAQLETLIKQTTQVIKEHLHSSEPTTIERFSIFCETSIEILHSLDGEGNKHFLKIVQELSPITASWDYLRSESSLQSLWSIAPFFDGELNFIEPQLFTSLNDEEQMMTAHRKMCLFLAHAVKEIFATSGSGDQEEFGEHEREREWRILIALELLWMKELLQRVPSIHNDRTRGNLLAKFEANLKPLFGWLARTDMQPFLLALFNKSQSQGGGIWALTLKIVISGLHNGEKESIPLDTFLTSCPSDFTQPNLQTLQALLTSDDSIYDLKVMVERHGKKWKETEESDSTGQMFHLCLVSCALERWVQLTRDSDIATMECRLTLLDILEEIRTEKDKIENLLLFSCCINNVEMSTLSLNMAIIRIFQLAVVNYSTLVNADQWDMILCCMLDWLQSCQESDLALVHVSAFTNHVSQLFETVAKVLCNCGKSSGKTAVGEKENVETDSTSPVEAEEEPLMEKLADEWREFFSNSACGNLLGLLSTVTGTDISNDPQLFASFHHLSEALSGACSYLSVDNLKEYAMSKSKPALGVEAGAVSKWPEDLLCELSPHLESTFSAFQVTSYRLLLKIIPLLASNEEKGESSVKEDDPARPPRSEIMSVIITGQSILQHFLSEAKVPFGETLGMANDFEALHVSRAYLLSWKLVLSYFVNSSEEVRVEYANYLHRGKYLNELLEILFRILPKKPNVGRRVSETSRIMEEKCFLDEEFVHCLAYEAYYDLVRTLPALVRQWWNNLDKNQIMIVEKYTTANVSPLLCEKEMQTVQRCSASYDNMEIVTRSSTREVIAYYKIEDISIELIVSLSASHPLGLITVNSGKRVGVKINQWRLWMMQLTTFLMHQNGTVMEGLQLWKRNMDKKFEGVDDCMICFSVIHGSNYSLPKLSCKTCKKKFHSACLYRWFSTSNNSTCPLCRNLF